MPVGYLEEVLVPSGYCALQELGPRVITENTVRRGFSPDALS